MALVTEDYPAACMTQQTILNPNQFRYQVDGFAQRFRTEGLPYPKLPDRKMTSSDKVIESLKQPGRAENGLCAISVSPNSATPGVLGQGVSPEPDFESLTGSSQRVPSSKTGELAENGSLASSNSEIPKPSSPTSRDALDEAIEEVAAFKDLVWKVHPSVTVCANSFQPLDYDEDLEPTEIVIDETDDEHSQNEGPELRPKR